MSQIPMRWKHNCFLVVIYLFCSEACVSTTTDLCSTFRFHPRHACIEEFYAFGMMRTVWFLIDLPTSSVAPTSSWRGRSKLTSVTIVTTLEINSQAQSMNSCNPGIRFSLYLPDAHTFEKCTPLFPRNSAMCWRWVSLIQKKLFNLMKNMMWPSVIKILKCTFAELSSSQHWSLVSYLCNNVHGWELR